MAGHLNTAEGAEPIDGPQASVKLIWKVFFILFLLTALEFVIALAIPLEVMAKPVKNFVYIALTLLKAFYIVAYFMHLKFERINLAYTILIPLVFICAFVAAMIGEASYTEVVRSLFGV
jgi:cytochrome c oxidase subunit 4